MTLGKKKIENEIRILPGVVLRDGQLVSVKPDYKTPLERSFNLPSGVSGGRSSRGSSSRRTTQVTTPQVIQPQVSTPTSKLSSKNIQNTISQIEQRRSTLRKSTQSKSLPKSIWGKSLSLTKKFLGLIPATQPLTGRFKSPKKKVQENELMGLTVTQTALENVLAVKELPNTVKQIKKNPRLLKEIPKGLLKEGKEISILAVTSPNEAIAKVGTELVLMKGTGQAISGISKGTKLQLAKLSPKYKGTLKTGKTIEVTVKAGKKTPKVKLTGIKKSTIPKEVRTLLSPSVPKAQKVKIKVVGKIPTESLASQVKRAGKTKTLVSTQADNLVKIIRRKKVIRKPFDTTKLSNRGKTLLKKYDKGKITGKELVELDKAVRKSGTKGILERSFFADPEARLRPSRLGLIDQQEAGILDLLSGKATLKKSKPQILVFPNQKIQKLPKALKSVQKKLSKGIGLTKKEADDLLKWQQTKSGKFKPVGFLTRESEVTLAPDEIIKRVKKIGSVNFKGKNVPIIQTKVVKPTGKLKSLINKVRKGKATSKQIKELDSLLKKKTGLDYGLSSTKNAKKYFNIKKKITLSGTKVISKTKTSKPKISYRKPSTKVKTISYKKASKPISRKPVSPKSPRSPKYKRPRSYKSPKYKKPTYYKSPKSPRSPTSYKRIIKPISKKSPMSYAKSRKVISKTLRPGKVIKLKAKHRPKKFKRIPKLKQGYDIYVKSKKKYIKLNIKPVSRQDALSRGAYGVDHSTARTLKIIPKGKIKKLGTISRKEKNYFNRVRNKFRPYKIKKGKKKGIVNAYIEKKGKPLIDTRGEKRGLTISRLAKRLKRKR